MATLGPRGPRVPPHDLDAEESLLGAMLLSGDAVVAAIEICGPGDFYKPAHGLIYAAIVSLFEAGEPVDAVTVADELRRADALEQVGDLAALVALQSNTPSLANAAHYARIVEEHALLRRLIRVAGELSELGYSVPEDVTAAVDEAERMVFELSERRTTETVASLGNLIGPSLDRIEELSHRRSRITGVETGFRDLDEILAGLQPQSLTIIGARPAMGKALALDTPLPTPTGWTTMGGVQAGDEVLDEQGQPCRVSYTSAVFLGHRCFRLRFDDGTSLVADAGHRWLAYDHRAWRSHAERSSRLARGLADHPQPGRSQAARWRRPAVVTTEDMLAAGVRTPDGSRPNWYISLTAPIEGRDVTLPVDPYLVGWLVGGGGARADRGGGPELEGVTPAGADPSAGAGAGAGDASRAWRIPSAYLRAPMKHRLALLQGLMDASGAVLERPGTVELLLSERGLLEQAWELVVSLGHKAGPIAEPGRSSRRCWRFSWAPLDPVFRTAAKAELFERSLERVLGPGGGRHSVPRGHTRRAVVAIEPVPSVPTRCIAVDSPSHLFLAGRCMVPTHNTSLGLGMLAHVGTALRRPALLFSLEMGHVELTQRLLASEARVDSQRMRTGHLHDSDWAKVGNAVSRLSESTIFIDENPHLTVMDIRARARRLRKSEGDLGLVVVDYLQLMTGRARAENRQVEVAEISRGLKILARELNCPVVALSQLSRNLEARQDKRPMLSDLRESGCMPASTRLLRADTGEEITLGELVLTEAQPLVWSLEDKTGRLVARRLTKAFPSGVKSVFRLRLASGYEVEATANHRFRTPEGWRRLDEIDIGERLAVPGRIREPLGSPSFAWSDDELVLLAHLLGSGSIGPHGVTYATENPANTRAVELAACRALGLEVRSTKVGPVWELAISPPEVPGRESRESRHPVRNWLEPHGLWSSGPHDASIPESVLGLGDVQVAHFLGHLWASAGTIAVQRGGSARPPVRVQFGTTSRRLADGVRRALLRLGVTSSVVPARKAGHLMRWEVRVTGRMDLERFLTVLGSHGPLRGRCERALRALRSARENASHDAAHGSAEARDGACGSRVEAASDILWDEVVEIVSSGLQPTFDATVDGTHNFVANGVVAHNSLEQDADVVLFIYREEVYDPETPIDRRGLAEIVVAKHRNGPTGSARLAFLTQFARFENLQQV